MTDPFDEMQTGTPTEEPAVESLGAADQFVGILSEPSATYENVQLAGPRTKDWLVPILVFLLIMIAGYIVKMSNDSIKAEMKQKQHDVYTQQVKNHTMTEEQAKQAEEKMESFAGMQLVFGAVGMLIVMPIFFFLIVFVYWLLVKFAFQGVVTYALLLSVCGLSMYIGAIDQLTSILLSYVTGHMAANLSPALFMQNAPVGDKLTTFLTFVNPLSIWMYYLQGIGFHKVAGISRAKGWTASYLLYIISILLTVFIGGMFTHRG